MDLDALFGEGWCVTLAPRPLAETLALMGVSTPVVCPGGPDGAAVQLEERQGKGPFVLGRALSDEWSLTIEFDSGIGSDDAVLRSLTTNGRAAISAYRDPDTNTATIAYDARVLGRLDLSGGCFDGPPDSVDTTHPVVRVLIAAGFDASDACEPTGEAATGEPGGCLVLAVRVLTGITLTTADFDQAWTGGLTHPRSPVDTTRLLYGSEAGTTTT